MIVIKFGGKTIGTPERLSRCLDLIEDDAALKPVIVVSAHGDTTDRLIEAANLALGGEIKTGAIREYHLDFAREHGVPAGMIEPLLTRLEALLHGIALIKELTPRTLDHVVSFGERLSSRVVAAALSARGTRSMPVNSYDAGLMTDSNFGNASPLPGIEKDIAAHLGSIDGIPVVTGFIGKDVKGEITTLGRSGSDFTATIIAAALNAEEVRIWKSVDGVMTADPSIEPKARNIPALSFEEASELAYFGAEVLHPLTLVPAIRKGIPVRVANVDNERDPGTVILAEPVLTDGIAKSIAYKENVCLIHLMSPRLHSVPEVLNKALSILGSCGIVAHMIMTSEAGISLVTQSGLERAVLDKAAYSLGEIARVDCNPAMTLVCVVGDEMRGNAKAVGRIFTALSEAKINARAITRSASEINVAFLVKEQDLASAVKSLHGLIVD